MDTTCWYEWTGVRELSSVCLKYWNECVIQEMCYKLVSHAAVKTGKDSIPNINMSFGDILMMI